MSILHPVWLMGLTEHRGDAGGAKRWNELFFRLFSSVAVNTGEKSRADVQACRCRGRRVNPSNCFTPEVLGLEDLSSRMGLPWGLRCPKTSLFAFSDAKQEAWRKRLGNHRAAAAGRGLRWHLGPCKGEGDQAGGV